jgi:hypothetical protein
MKVAQLLVGAEVRGIRSHVGVHRGDGVGEGVKGMRAS